MLAIGSSREVSTASSPAAFIRGYRGVEVTGSVTRIEHQEERLRRAVVNQAGDGLGAADRSNPAPSATDRTR